MYEFLKQVAAECEKQDVKLILSPDQWVYTSGTAARCLGFFDNEELVVATGSPGWAGILAHEFGHFQQFSEGLFKQPEDGGPDYYDLLEDWYAGRDTGTTRKAQKRLQAAFDFVMACELDAERRAVGLISRHRLVVSMPDYIARANGYIVSHLWAQKHQAWPFVPPAWAKLVPTDRMWSMSEVILTPELEDAITRAQQVPKKVDFGA